MLSRRRGAGLRIKKKAHGFMCGCGGSKAVSISDGSDDKHSPMATPPTAAASSVPTTTTMSSFTATTTTTGVRGSGGAGGKVETAATADQAPSSFSPSSRYVDDTTTDDAHSSSVESTPSLSALLRQLRELERNVRFLQSPAAAPAGVGGAGTDAAGSTNDGGGGGRRVEESVAVVKESADPLGDFRGSMLQMIVEKEIVGGAELRDLLHRFLSLNSPQHHHLILRAFADIWEEVFAGRDRTPDLLASHRRRNLDEKKLRTVRA